MISFAVRFLALASFAVALPLLSASAPAAAKSKYDCFTDDGYGRKQTCSYAYQKRVEKKPTTRK